MKTVAIAYVVTAVAFLVIDAIWLSTMASRLYKPLIGDLMAENPNFAAAAIFYLIYVGGMLFFAVMPGVQSGSWQTALLNGAVLGFVAYATYDLTNQATLKNWPTMITVADLIWGTFVTATSSAIGAAVTGWLVRPN